LIGAEITPDDAPPVLLYAPDKTAYRRLARLITRGRRAAVKGDCRLHFQDIAEHADGLLAAVLVNDTIPPAAGLQELWRYRSVFADRCYLAAALHHGADDERRLEQYLWLTQKALSRDE
jgi:error-prone DNA polymerase